jgi:hypothetical protein
MRGTLSSALLASALAFAPAALGQRGAGMGMGHPGHFSGHAGIQGGHPMGGAYSRGFNGFSSGYRAYPLTGVPRMVSPAPAHALNPGYRIPTLTNGGSLGVQAYGWNQARGRRGHEGYRGHDRDRDRRYRSPYRGFGGYGYGYPGYVNSWSVLPWDLSTSDWGGSDYSGDDGNLAAQQVSPESQQQAETYEPSPESAYRPAYEGALSVPPPPPDVVAAPVAPEPELTLIFRDGHREAIHNYVLTRDTVVVLDQAASGRQQRISLADIDLAATQQSARAAGLDFTPPA